VLKVVLLAPALGLDSFRVAAGVSVAAPGDSWTVQIALTFGVFTAATLSAESL
jgi:putative Mn2+ efflux pump MntP